jgi:hypothetical protein
MSKNEALDKNRSKWEREYQENAQKYLKEHQKKEVMESVKRLLWVTGLIIVFSLFSYDRACHREAIDTSSTNLPKAAQTQPTSSSTPTGTLPSVNPSHSTVKVRLRVFSKTVSGKKMESSIGVQLKGINSSKMGETDANGSVTFDGVVCDEYVDVSLWTTPFLRSLGLYYEPITYPKRFLKCGDDTINLGDFKINCPRPDCSDKDGLKIGKGTLDIRKKNAPWININR